ncbi:hypothetical protein PPL_04813 [Heterostelium album PN500]|uniref:Uncharacterized protein n=1 Tax=Heterostelium pallidum (strain ATCC 26659 / Pp 5 / PN500) TaxID=670386 RepID=D3B8M0_HETP5|nr:hypothetical protein PPL_04813 [Heterostelium album PN500]EFA82388.1 hypothetical protein PPL_04813 [Heterostelium album PN500]|eukprot:XP_020434505.1 hypothetical protein PPL_04813 [Heterostelium album PN500]
MSIPPLMQSKIIKYLCEKGDVWIVEVSLVSKHFFKIVKEIIGSSIRFDFGISSNNMLSSGSHEDEIIFNNFCNAIIDLIISMSFLAKLLKSAQWTEWNKTKELQHLPRIKVRMLHCDGYSSEIKWVLKKNRVAKYISEFSLYADFECEDLGRFKLPRSLKRLTILASDDMDSLPSDSMQIEYFLQGLRKCKQLQHLSFQSGIFERLLSKESGLFFWYIISLKKLKSLEIIGIAESIRGVGFGDGEPEWNDQIINHLKAHKQITEFSFGLAYNIEVLHLQQYQLLEYLFSQDCVVQRIKALSMLSNEIPKIQRNIQYLFVGIEMSVGHFTIESLEGRCRYPLMEIKRYSRTEEQSLLAKQEIEHQVQVAINEFNYIDHLVICDSMEERRDDFNQINADSNHTKSKNYFFALDYLEFVEQLRVGRESANQKIEIRLSNEMQKYWIILGCPNSEYSYLDSDDDNDSDYSRNNDEDYEEYFDDSAFEDSEYENDEETAISIEIESNINN